MRYSDLHCDTVSRAFNEKKSFIDGDLHINMQKVENIEKYRQYFALWLSDGPEGETAFSLCNKMLDYYEKHFVPIISKCTDISAHLSMENATALCGDPYNVSYFKSRGVEIMSLTWNGENSLASGADAAGGLKAQGREVIKEMVRENIALDVSHLNEKGFYEVCLIDSVKIIASHSNCYDICPHRRNLKEWQIKELIGRDSLIGLNFYPLFLGKGKIEVFEKIKNNIEYLLQLGGEDNIAFGSDFDGAKMSPRLDGIDKVAELYEYLLSFGFSEELLEKIFYKNAVRVLG